MNRDDVTETLAKPISQQLLASSIPARLAGLGYQIRTRAAGSSHSSSVASTSNAA